MGGSPPDPPTKTRPGSAESYSKRPQTHRIPFMHPKMAIPGYGPVIQGCSNDAVWLQPLHVNNQETIVFPNY